MPHPHWPRFAALSILSFAILFQYQNCAPGGKQSSPAAASLSDQNNVVHAMGGGPSSAQAVQLSSSVVHLTATETEASVTGSCPDQQTPTLGWTLRDPATGEDLAQGSTACINNSFNMELATNQALECNKVYDLQVNEAEATVTKDCQN